jgi:hypothetical protein
MAAIGLCSAPFLWAPLWVFIDFSACLQAYPPMADNQFNKPYGEDDIVAFMLFLFAVKAHTKTRNDKVAED